MSTKHDDSFEFLDKCACALFTHFFDLVSTPACGRLHELLTFILECNYVDLVNQRENLDKLFSFDE